MTKFTVVLLRPDYLCEDEPYGQDIYVASVVAESAKKAVTMARKEVFKADKKDGMEPKSEDDYALCVAFEGHPETTLFGWQL